VAEMAADYEVIGIDEGQFVSRVKVLELTISFQISYLFARRWPIEEK
jgi:hypothetical protein